MSYTKSSVTTVQSARRRWVLLAFMSGTINAGGFLACGRYVTHVTGFATQFGIDMANREVDLALGMLLVPLFFLFGSFISGYLIDVQLEQKKEPRFDLVMLLMTVSLLICTICGNFGFFGEFRNSTYVKSDLVLLILLCFASGLQNALISTSSGAVIRTTHLTGLTTDLAIGIAKNMGAKKLHQTRDELVNNQIRIGIIVAFIIGSTVGSVIFMRFEYWGFLLPAAISLYATRLVFRHKKQKKLIENIPGSTPK